MGSLRWWAEALLRGHEEFFACDPVLKESSCPSKIKRGGDQLYCYCNACLLFGATGLRRSFGIQLSGGNEVYNDNIRTLRIRPRGRNRGWYLGSGICGNLNLLLIPYGASFDPMFILLPLTIASHWGGLGARTQLGYGVLELVNSSVPEAAANILRRLSKALLSPNYCIRKGENDLTLPSLRNMFFAKVRFSPKNENWWKKVDGIMENEEMKEWVKSGSVPIAPAIKNWLRYGRGRNLWQCGEAGKVSANEIYDTEKYLFGATNNYRTAAKINISSAYRLGDGQWEFRLWGWLPLKKAVTDKIRETFLKKLKESLAEQKESSPYSVLGEDVSKGSPVLTVWREFASERDTVTGESSDYLKYLDSLAKGEEGRP